MENRYRIFNTYVDNLTMGETIKKVEKIISIKVPTQHVVINASKINLMLSNPELTQIVNNCNIINADGASILWANKIINGFRLKERVAGIDLFLELVNLANNKEYKIFLFGAREEVVLKVKKIFEAEYPNIKIVGTRNGYFNENDELDIVEEIRESNADMLFVAFSSPNKEFWINKYLNEMEVPFVMGVGGSFDVVAGVTTRAPLWMQRMGLEWFHRFLQEPIRMFRRYLIGNLKFILNVFRYKKLSRL